MRIPRAICVIGLMLLLWGILKWPTWWYRFIFEGQYTSWSHWVSGISYIWDYFLNSDLLAILAALWALLALSHTSVPNRLYNISLTAWNRYVIGNKTHQSLVVFAILIIVGVGVLETRSREERDLDGRLAEFVKYSPRSIREDKPPLSEPTSFLYLDADEVSSLYGQNEPDLIPAMIISELKDSKELEGEIAVGNYLKTSAGKTIYERSLTEYRKIDKNPQRKLRDLLQFLYEERKLKRYGPSEWKTQDLRNLEEASSLFAKYELLPDPLRLKALRDRLLADQLRSLSDELTILRGLVLVEGDWSLSDSGDRYSFRKPFIENVSDPPFCEIHIRKALVSTKNQDLIGNLSGSTMRLSVFGNVSAGLSQKSRTIQLNPIAVF